MSVPAPKRRESPYDVSDNADAIFEDIVKFSRKAPKDYFKPIYEPLINLSNEVSILISKGNKIHIDQNTTLEEFMFRHMYYVSARSSLEALSKRVDLIVKKPFCIRYYDNSSKHIKGITENELTVLACKIDKEDNLLAGAIKSDTKRILNFNPSWEDKIKNNIIVYKPWVIY